MNSNEIQDLFKKHNDHFGKFDEIENKLHFNKKLCAMLKISSLFKNEKDFEFSLAQNVMYLSVSPCSTDDDVLYLVRCGVWYEPLYDNFCINF